MTLQEFITKFEENNVTIINLAKVYGMSDAGVRRVAKQPIKGEIYDPNKINYEGLYNLALRLNINLDEVKFEELGSKKRTTKELVKPQIGDNVELDDKIYQVVTTTSTMLCLQLEDELRAMSYTRLTQLLTKDPQ